MLHEMQSKLSAQLIPSQLIISCYPSPIPQQVLPLCEVVINLEVDHSVSLWVDPFTEDRTHMAPPVCFYSRGAYS